MLEGAAHEEMATVLVDLQDVLSILEIVVRIDRGYERLKGPICRNVESLLRTWNIGLSLGGGGFTATLQRNPHVDAESVLLRLLEMPTSLFDRQGIPSLIVFDEIQDVLAVPGADGKIRSVIQHQGEAATYAFAGSAPGMMQQAVRRPDAPVVGSAGRGKNGVAGELALRLADVASLHEPFGRPLRRHRTGDVVALGGVAVEVCHRLQGLAVLDALGDDPEVESVRGLDHQRDQTLLARVGCGGEHPVDLEDVGGQVGELGDRGVAGAEVVDGDVGAEIRAAGELVADRGACSARFR